MLIFSASFVANCDKERMFSSWWSNVNRFSDCLNFTLWKVILHVIYLIYRVACQRHRTSAELKDNLKMRWCQLTCYFWYLWKYGSPCRTPSERRERKRKRVPIKYVTHFLTFCWSSCMSMSTYMNTYIEYPLWHILYIYILFIKCVKKTLLLNA